MDIIKVLEKLFSASLLLLKSDSYNAKCLLFLNYSKYIQLTKLPGLIKDQGLNHSTIFFHSFCCRLDNPTVHLLVIWNGFVAKSALADGQVSEFLKDLCKPILLWHA